VFRQGRGSGGRLNSGGDDNGKTEAVTDKTRIPAEITRCPSAQRPTS